MVRCDRCDKDYLPERFVQPGFVRCPKCEGRNLYSSAMWRHTHNFSYNKDRAPFYLFVHGEMRVFATEKARDEFRKASKRVKEEPPKQKGGLIRKRSPEPKPKFNLIRKRK